MGPGPKRRSWRSPMAIAIAAGALLALFAPVGAMPATAHAPHGVTLPNTAPRLAPSPVRALADAPSPAALDLDWSDAFIYYLPSDPAGFMFGEGSVIAVDDAIQNTTTFGGEGVDGLSNVTLVWNNGTVGNWSYANSPETPSPRANTSFASYEPGGFALLFGGLVSLRSHATTNDTWRYWFGNETWENISRGLAPPARENAAFAVDPTAGIGLLEGGIDPDYSTGGSSGSVLWNDTWEVNVTTGAWSPLAARYAPPPMFGSSMVWDPLVGEFVLYGGCGSLGCTSSVWTFAPGSTQWVERSIAGSAGPSARGSAAFVWDPVDNVTLLFGGFDPAPNATSALGGTYALNGSLGGWLPLSETNAPPPEYDAGAAFSDYPGCVGMWVQGGNGAASGIEYNDYVLQPAIEPGFNCFTIASTTGSSPPKKCSNQNATVTVQVLNGATRDGLEGAQVEFEGTCGQSSGVTGAAGFLNLSDAAPDTISITARHSGFHSGALNGTLSGYPGQLFSLSLTPLPELHAHVLGRNQTGVFPVVDAPVATGAIIVGNTSDDGWVNATAPPSLNGSLAVTVTPAGYSTATATVPLPYTGDVFANLTVSAYGPIDVELTDALTGAPLADVPAQLNFVDPLGANSTLFQTNGAGWYNTSLRAGNYSVGESIPGYFPNATDHAFYHPWINRTVVVLGAVPQYGADVDVQVLNRVLATPVPNATVTFGGSTKVLDNPLGWANATNLGPPGYLTVSASAPGFYPNATTVTIAPYAVVPFVLHLTPAPPCSVFAACPPTPVPPAVFVGLSFLPGPGAARDILLVTPAALVAAGAIYVLLARRRPPLRSTEIPRDPSGEVYQRRPAPPFASERG